MRGFTHELARRLRISSFSLSWWARRDWTGEELPGSEWSTFELAEELQNPSNSRLDSAKLWSPQPIGLFHIGAAVHLYRQTRITGQLLVFCPQRQWARRPFSMPEGWDRPGKCFLRKAIVIVGAIWASSQDPTFFAILLRQDGSPAPKRDKLTTGSLPARLAI